MKNKNTFLIIISVIFVLFFLLGVFFLMKNSKPYNQSNENSQSITNSKEKPNNNDAEINMMLDGFPSPEIPLHKMIMISSLKYIVDSNPQNFAGYFDKNSNYYNVVFETEATPEEIFEYYRSVMDEINPENYSDQSVEGKIGKYRLSISHYGNNPKNYAYLQVHIPTEEHSQENRYYQNYPEIFALDNSWVEYMNSYGLLNQKGGEIEFSQWFMINPELSSKSIPEFAKEYEQKYKDKANFSFDQESGLMTWRDDPFSVTISFSEDHGRIYLTMRRGME